MVWYIVILALMLCPMGVVYRGKQLGENRQGFALGISCAILGFFMAMRDLSVGVDTKYYGYVFSQFRDIPVQEVFSAVTYATEKKTWSFDFEPGYRLLNKLLSFLSADPQAITVFNSLVILALVYFLIRRNSSDYMLSIWLYITLGIYQTQMNVTRNAIAILLVYNFFCYVKDGAFKKYALCCLAAATIHSAALLFIFMYWFFREVEMNRRNISVMFLTAGGVSVVFPLVRPWVTMLLPGKLGKYLAGGGVDLGALIVGVFYAVLVWYVCRAMTRDELSRVFEECDLGVHMFVMNMALFCLTLSFKYAARMAGLFGPYLIILLPQMLERIESPEKRKKVRYAVYLLCGVQYVMRLLVNNIGGTMPYQFFW